jgi:hypothetical protein
LLEELQIARATAQEESNRLGTVIAQHIATNGILEVHIKALEDDRDAFGTENGVLDGKNGDLQAALAQVTAERDQFREVREVMCVCSVQCAV